MLDIKGNYFYFQYPYKNHKELLEAIEATDPQEKSSSTFGSFSSVEKKSYLATDFKELLLQPIEYFAFENGIGLDVDVLNPWMNVYRKKDFLEIHNHPASDLSVVIFLNDGPNFGQFYFSDPSYTQFNRMWYPILEKINRGSIWIPEVKAGDVILFPSHMMHGVSPHKSNQIRKTFAYNVIFKNVPQ